VNAADRSEFEGSGATVCRMSRIFVAGHAEIAAALEAAGHAVVERDADLAVVSDLGALSALRRTPVIVLTPKENVMAAFDAGAADVVTLPASPAEVVARANAILRRILG
jgi:DNA-binding response OmpR family regulator